MKPGTSRYLILFFVLAVQFGLNECWRSSRPSSSRPSPSRRPTPSPHRPFPTHAPTYRPFPTYRPTHAPTYRPFPTHAPTYRPFPTHAPTYKPFPTHSPTYRPTPTRAPTYRPFPTHAPTYRPYPTSAPTYRPYPTSAPTYRPYPTHSPTYRPSPTHYPTMRTTRYPTRYPTQRYPTEKVHDLFAIEESHLNDPSIGWQYPEDHAESCSTGTTKTVCPHPTYPGYTNAGINTPKHYQPSYSVPVRVPAPGGSKIKIYNINNYHSPGYWAPPSYPVYHYSYRDTGNSALGFYLGYSLGRISHPTYYHQDHRFYDGYSPRYDHYTVHHYYHNSESIPRQQTVTTKVIIQCGDGSLICPANTTALCTANGQIMCVVIASNTVPCEDKPNMRCVKSTIPCENNEAPECKGLAKGQSATVSIPCISNTTIEGNITTVNNTIVSNDPKHKNITLKSLAPEITTASILTTTEKPVSSTVPDLGSKRRKRDVAPPQFCVTVVAEPSKRAPTEGEQVFKEITSVFDKFFTKAFGMDKQVPKPPPSVKDDNYIPNFGD